jgi:hypothetical protein
MTDMMKPQKKKRNEVLELYDKILRTSPSPIDSATKSLVFIWMYFFVQGEITHAVLTTNLLGVDINPLDVSYFVEELEQQKDTLKKYVLDIRYEPRKD